MDLVKIGFQINANGLKDANKQVDDLLSKVDKIGTQGKKSAADFETSQKKVKESSKEAAKEVDKTTKALEKQKIIGEYLGKGLDKTTATTVANFKLMGATASQTNEIMSELGNQKGILQARKEVEALVRQQQKANEALIKQEKELEKVRQQRYSAEQKYWAKVQDDARKTTQKEDLSRQRKLAAEQVYYLKVQEEAKKVEAKKQAQLDKSLAREDSLRQKKLLAEQNYYLKVQEEVKKAQAKELALKEQQELREDKLRQKRLSAVQQQYLKDMDMLKKQQDAEEVARQKKYSAEQREYLKTQELLKKQQEAHKAAQDKIAANEEIARQRRFAAEQKHYQRTMQLAEQERIASTKKQVVSITGVAVSQGSLPSLIALQKAADGARKSNSGLLASIKGITAYALLSTAIYGVITALSNLAVNFVETADEMTNLTQRLGIYLPANIKVNQVLERMGEIAKENRVTLADTGKLFTQLLPPVQRIKGGVAETTAIVDAFGKAMLIGGANTKEAASATIQFGQAMASGKLAGDEFRSLAEASPRLLQAIADGAGIAAQKLKEMSAAGKLTSGLVSAALLDQFIQLEYEALKMGQTVSGAFNEGMVSYQIFVDKFNKQTGFTDSIVQSIRDMVKFLEGIGNSFLKSLEDSNSTLNSFLSMLKTVWDLVGSLVSGFTDVVGWIIKGGEKTGLWKTIFDSVKMAIITIVDVLAKIPFAIVNIGVTITDKVLTPFRKFIELAQRGLDMAGFANAAAKLGEGLTGYKENVTVIKSITGDVISGFNLLSLGVKKTENSTGNISTLLESLKTQNSNLVVQEQEKKAMTDKQYISEYAKLLLQKEGIDANKQNLDLVKKELEERFKITQQQAKDLKQQGEIQAKKDEAEAKAKKDAEKRKREAEQDAQRIENNLKGYQDELDYIDRVLKYREKGVALDVARIAAEKNYFEIWKDDAMAQTIIQAQKDLAKAEYLEDLKIESELLQRIQKIQDLGVSTDQARALAQAGFRADAEGIAAAAQLTHNDLVNQSYVLADQVKQQIALNHYINQGVKAEEAAIAVSFARLAWMQKATGVAKDGLTDEQKKIKESMLLRAKELRTEQQNTALTLSTKSILEQNSEIQKDITAETSAYTIALTKARLANMDASEEKVKDLVLTQSTNAALLRRQEVQLQLNNLAKGYTTEMSDFMNAYPTLVDEDYKRTVHAEKLYKILKKQQEVVDKKKETPFGDFSKVDFNVFGDFGNPFEEALAGVNTYLSKMTELQGELKTLKQAHLDAGIAAEEAALKSGTDSEGYKAALENVKTLAKTEQDKLKEKKEAQEDAFASGLKFSKSFFKEESKGYKIVSALEQALQAKKIAFALWEKKDEIALLALKIKAHVTDALGFTTGAAAKLAAQSAVNVAKGTEAVLSQGSGDPYTAFARMAAMAAVVAGLGVAVGAIGGGSGSAPTPSNNGTGTVFGDSTAQSESIKKSIDLLADNSDLMLPINNAMLRALKNIESNIGGLTNLLIRTGVGKDFNIAEGFKMNGIGSGITNTFSLFNDLTFGLADFLTLGLFSAVGDLLGGLFGTKTTVKGQGLFGADQTLASILENGFSLQEYVDVNTKKKTLGITTSNKNKTILSAADQQLANQFTLIFQGFYDSILNASTALGMDVNTVADALEGTVISMGKINLQGLNGEQIQEKLMAVFGAAADKLAQTAVKGLDDFQRVGEGYYETLVRVATGIEQAAYYTDQLGYTAIQYTDIIAKQGDVASEIVRQSVLLVDTTKNIKGGFYDLVNTFEGSAEELTNFIFTLRDLQDQLFMTGKNADYLTSSMILGAGGLDGLSSGLDAYFEMLSPAEQAAELTRRLANEFAIFGKDLPANVQAYRDLLNSITDTELATEAGQKLYGQIIALAPEFNDLQDALKKAEEEAKRLADEAKAAAEEAKKLADEFEAMMVKLRRAIFITGQSASNITKAMIDAAGGGDALLKGLEAIFGMLKPAEKATELTRRLKEQFDALGVALPSSNDAFRALVEGINTTTEAGQELFGKLVALTPEFVELQNAMQAAQDEAQRLAEEAAEAARILAELKTAFFITGQDVSRMTQVMIDAAGGTDKMRSGLEAMFDMLSPAEKATELTRRLTVQFKDLGLTLPNSTDAFRALVKGMDTSTDSGKALLGKVIALAPEFNDLQSALDSANNEVNQLVESLRDLAEQARQARGETEQPRNLDYVRAMFESTAMLAMQGDIDAANKLLSLGNNLMDLSKQYSTSGSEYARDLAWIQRAATISADVQESGLGYTSTTLSTSLSSGNTTPTLATTSSSTDTEIKGLREDLNAALLAIAKYTQSTANKLENWDDGNRVMVGVIQEAGDPKVPVTTA